MAISDTDKIVAAILAASRAAQRGLQEPNEYVDAYQDFLELLGKHVVRNAEKHSKEGARDMKKVFPEG